jgi:hypothetical protein
MRLLVLLPILAACTASETEPTPDHGAHLRLLVDDFVFPTTDEQATSFGSDLDGDNYPDNQIGELIADLMEQADIRDDASVRALIDSDQLASSLEIFAGSDDPDEIVGLQYFATPSDGGAVLRGSSSSGGGFATLGGLQQGAMTLVLPALVDADPTPLELEWEQLQLAPSGSGAYEVRLQGLVDQALAQHAVCTNMLQMIANNPSGHAGIIQALDLNMDGTVTMTECLDSNAIASLLAANVIGPDKIAYVSIGIAMHVFTPRNVPPFE